jgi:hypothetical protein
MGLVQCGARENDRSALVETIEVRLGSCVLDLALGILHCGSCTVDLAYLALWILRPVLPCANVSV